MIDRLYAADVDEVACLIDFGVDTDDVIGSFPHIARLKDVTNDRRAYVRHVLSDYLAERLPEPGNRVDIDIIVGI